MSSSPIGRVITRREGTRAGMCNVNVVKLSVSARVKARLRVRTKMRVGPIVGRLWQSGWWMRERRCTLVELRRALRR